MLEKRADYCQLPAETTSLARLPATIIEITLRFSHPSPTHSTRDEIEPALHQLIKWLFMNFKLWYFLSFYFLSFIYIGNSFYILQLGVFKIIQPFIN